MMMMCNGDYHERSIVSFVTKMMGWLQKKEWRKLQRLIGNGRGKASENGVVTGLNADSNPIFHLSAMLNRICHIRINWPHLRLSTYSIKKISVVIAKA